MAWPDWPWLPDLRHFSSSPVLTPSSARRTLVGTGFGALVTTDQTSTAVCGAGRVQSTGETRSTSTATLVKAVELRATRLLARNLLISLTTSEIHRQNYAVVHRNAAVNFFCNNFLRISTDFGTLCIIFIARYQEISPHLAYVSTLPCKIRKQRFFARAPKNFSQKYRRKIPRRSL